MGYVNEKKCLGYLILMTIFLLMVAYFVGYPHSLHSTSDFPRDRNLSLTMTEREVIIKERKLARLKSGDWIIKQHCSSTLSARNCPRISNLDFFQVLLSIQNWWIVLNETLCNYFGEIVFTQWMGFKLLISLLHKKL